MSEIQFSSLNHIFLFLILLLLLILLFLLLLKLANEQFKGFKWCSGWVGSCTLAYECVCVDPRSEKLTKCIKGVNSLTNTIF